MKSNIAYLILAFTQYLVIVLFVMWLLQRLGLLDDLYTILSFAVTISLLEGWMMYFRERAKH